MLLAFPFLLGAKAHSPEEHLICREGFLQIVSPDPIGVDECRRVGAMAIEAWNFDLKQMEWSPSVNMRRPLTFRLLSTERMKTEHGGVLGIAKGSGDLFLASTAVLHNPTGKGTLAHELGHIQAFRALGPDSSVSLKVPHYFLEGHGLSMGRAYRDHLGLGGNEFDAGGAKIVANLTPKEARLILTTNTNYYRGDRHKERVMEAFAVFFVEYLRVRKGMPDAVGRMGRVFELVGRGKTYETAFKQTYGLSVDRAVSEITAFMERTESTPAERLKGTRYDGLL